MPRAGLAESSLALLRAAVADEETVARFHAKIVTVPGIGCSRLWSRAVAGRGHGRFSGQLEVGAVFVNNYDRATTGSPFGGTKHSGYGREHTPDTLAEFGYTRTVRLPSGTRPFPRWPALDDLLPTD